MAVKRIKNHSSGKRQTVVVDYKSILTTSKPEKSLLVTLPVSYTHLTLPTKA